MTRRRRATSTSAAGACLHARLVAPQRLSPRFLRSSRLLRPPRARTLRLTSVATGSHLSVHLPELIHTSAVPCLALLAAPRSSLAP